MKNVGVVAAVAATVVVVLGVAVFSFAPSGATAAPAPGAPTDAPAGAPAAVAPAAPVDPAAVQAAFAAREALLQAQIAELDRELADRQADYAARAQELADLIAAGEGQLAQLTEQETALQTQVSDLRVALADRQTVYAAQRGQAAAQYQANFDQLQLQLTEANARLADARAQLGQ